MHTCKRHPQTVIYVHVLFPIKSLFHPSAATLKAVLFTVGTRSTAVAGSVNRDRRLSTTPELVREREAWCRMSVTIYIPHMGTGKGARSMV